MQTINPSTPSIFKAKLSPWAHGSKTKPGPNEVEEEIETSPKKLEWRLTPDLRAGVRYAETRISDLICQNDSQALEFKAYGSNFIKRHGFSPDAFVQMAFQAAYYGLYGACDSDGGGVVARLTEDRSRREHVRARNDQGVPPWSDRGDQDCAA